VDSGGERDLVRWSSRGGGGGGRSVDVELGFGVARREGRRESGSVGGHGDLEGASGYLREKGERGKAEGEGGREGVDVEGRIDELEFLVILGGSALERSHATKGDFLELKEKILTFYTSIYVFEEDL